MRSHSISFISMLLMCVLPYALEAQNSHLEQLQRLNLSPEQQVDSLLYYTQFYKHSDPELALVYCNALLKYAAKEGVYSSIADGLREKGRIFLNLGMMDSAQFCCNRTLELSKKLQDRSRMGNAAYLQAVIYLYTEGPVKANKAFKKSYAEYILAGDSTGMSNAMNGIGATFYQMGNHDSAMYYYLSALSMSEKIGKFDLAGRLYINVALLYDELEDHNRAIYYNKQSIPINRRLNNLFDVVKAYNALGNLYIQQNQLDSAQSMYLKCLEISLEVQNSQGMADAYSGMGDVSNRLRDFVRARNFFTKALEKYGEISHVEGVINSKSNLAMIEVNLGNYKQGLNVFLEILEMTKEYGYKYRQAEVLWKIQDTYARMGRYQQGYNFVLRWATLQDSILNEDMNQQIAHYEVLYNVEKQKAENETVKSESLVKDLLIERRTHQRNTYLFGGAGIALILVFLFSYYSQRIRKNRIINEQRIRQLEEEKKMLAARSIVEGQEEERKRIAKELHDGLGVLLSSAKMHFTTIRDKTPENKELVDKAASLLEQATGDVRRISHNMMPGLLTRYGFFEAVLDLFEQVDEMEGIAAKVDIDGEQKRLPENTEIMLYRIVQELVNNTLKHAGAKNVTLGIGIQAGQLALEYKDDGKGFDAEAQSKSRSLGLTSIQSRVKFLGGKMKFHSARDSGVRYTIVIPE